MHSGRVAVGLATCFGVGRSPVAPGTAGSLCAWAAAWLLVHGAGLPAWTLGAVAAALLPAGAWAASAAAAEFGSEDPPEVVIDEVVGQWIALSSASEAALPEWIAALVLFRAFDIAKPFGIRRLERLAGGWGVMADDLAAGSCAMLGVAAARWLIW